MGSTGASSSDSASTTADLDIKLSCNLGVAPGPEVTDVWGRISFTQEHESAGSRDPVQVKSFFGNLEIEEDYSIEVHQGASFVDTCMGVNAYKGNVGGFLTRASRRGPSGVGGFKTSPVVPTDDELCLFPNECNQTDSDGNFLQVFSGVSVAANDHIVIVDSYGEQVACCTLEAQ